MYRKMIFVMALPLALLVASSAKADITTFDASGTFADGATLSGTISIDTTAGDVTAADLFVSAPIGLEFNNILAQQANYPVAGIYYVEINTGGAGYPIMPIGLDASSLVGYTGGQLVSGADPVGGYASGIYTNSDHTVGLSTGELTTATAPEPVSVLLFGTVVAGAALMKRKVRAS